MISSTQGMGPGRLIPQDLVPRKGACASPAAYSNRTFSLTLVIRPIASTSGAEADPGLSPEDEESQIIANEIVRIEQEIARILSHDAEWVC